MPIESFVTTLIDWTFVLMTRTKWAFVGFVAARNCMRQQVLDDGKSVPNCGWSQSATLPSHQAVTSTTLYYKVHSSITLYYKVLLQYYTTPILLQYYSLLGIAKYCSSTTLYYKVIQSTTPVLLCTTKHYSSTTRFCSSTARYYKVLLHYYSVLQSTTPVPRLQYYKVLLQYYYVLQSTTPVLQSTTPLLLRTTKHYSSTTPYYKALLQYDSVLGQYYKATLMIDPRHIWNVIYNARSNRFHPPTSSNTAPARKSDSHALSSSQMKRHLHCAEQQMSPSNLTKHCHERWFACLILSHMKRHLQCAGQQVAPSNLTKYWACHANDSHVWSSSHMKRHLHCAEQQVSPSNLPAPATQNDHSKSDRNLLKTAEASFTVRSRSEHDPRMIRAWSEN